MAALGDVSPIPTFTRLRPSPLKWCEVKDSSTKSGVTIKWPKYNRGNDLRTASCAVLPVGEDGKTGVTWEEAESGGCSTDGFLVAVPVGADFEPPTTAAEMMEDPRELGIATGMKWYKYTPVSLPCLAMLKNGALSEVMLVYGMYVDLIRLVT